MLSQEDLDLQKFQMESNAIIEYFLSAMPYFVQEDGTHMNEDFCRNLEDLSDEPQLIHKSNYSDFCCNLEDLSDELQLIHKSNYLNNFGLVDECCLDKQLTVPF